jgi:hypothetical protein
MRGKNLKLLVENLQSFKLTCRQASKIEYPQLAALRISFDWQDDPQQADMFAAAILQIRKGLNPDWKTPLQMLVEVLVRSWRSTQVKQLARFEPELFIRWDHKTMTFKDFITSEHVFERLELIPDVYFQVVSRLL